MTAPADEAMSLQRLSQTTGSRSSRAAKGSIHPMLELPRFTSPQGSDGMSCFARPRRAIRNMPERTDP